MLDPRCVGSPPGQAVLRVAGKAVLCEKDPSSADGPGGHILPGMIPCCHKGVHTLPGYSDTQQCCLDQSQARRGHRKEFPMAKTA